MTLKLFEFYKSSNDMTFLFFKVYLLLFFAVLVQICEPIMFCKSYGTKTSDNGLPQKEQLAQIFHPKLTMPKQVICQALSIRLNGTKLWLSGTIQDQTDPYFIATIGHLSCLISEMPVYWKYKSEANIAFINIITKYQNNQTRAQRCKLRAKFLTQISE